MTATGAAFAEAILAGPQGMIDGGACPMFGGTKQSADATLNTAKIEAVVGAAGPVVPTGGVGNGAVLMEATMLMIHSHVQGFGFSRSTNEGFMHIASIIISVWKNGNRVVLHGLVF